MCTCYNRRATKGDTYLRPELPNAGKSRIAVKAVKVFRRCRANEILTSTCGAELPATDMTANMRFAWLPDTHILRSYLVELLRKQVEVFNGPHDLTHETVLVYRSGMLCARPRSTSRCMMCRPWFSLVREGFSLSCLVVGNHLICSDTETTRVKRSAAKD